MFLCFSIFVRIGQNWQHFVSVEEWNKASQLADAYKIGKGESEAAVNLLRNVDKDVFNSLATSVKLLV